MLIGDGKVEIVQMLEGAYRFSFPAVHFAVATFCTFPFATSAAVTVYTKLTVSLMLGESSAIVPTVPAWLFSSTTSMLRMVSSELFVTVMR